MCPRSGVIAFALIVFAAALVHGAQDRYGDPLPDGATQRLGTLRMRFAGGLGDLCYHPDGRGVFAVDRSIEIWDLQQGKLDSAFEVAKGGIVSLHMRRDGKAALVADSATVYECDLAARKVLRSWPTQQVLRRACYSPDGKRVLTTGANPPTLKEWDLESGRELISITGRMHSFNEGIYGPDGRTAFVDGSAGSDCIAAHYDLVAGKLLHEWLKDYYAHSRSILLSQDGKRVLIGSRHMATEWLIEGWKSLNKFTGHHGHAVTSVAYCKDPDQILTGSRDGSIRRWNRLESKVLLRWCPHTSHVMRMAVSPDGQWVLSYGGRQLAQTSLATGEPRLKWDRHEGPVQAVAFLPDGRRVVSASTDATLRVWDIAIGASERLIPGATLGAYALAVSPDGLRAAAGCKDGAIREFNLETGALLRELKGHVGYVRSLAYTQDGGCLISSGDDGSIRVWTGETGAELCVPQLGTDPRLGHRGGVLAIALSPDGERLASGGRDGSVRVWTLETSPAGMRASLLRALCGHRSWVSTVAFAAGGREVVSGGLDRYVLRWDVESGKVLAEMEGRSAVYAVRVSPDEVSAYSGDDGGVICWDLPSGKRGRDLKGHQQAVYGLAVSSDGKHIVTGSGDSTLLVWNARHRTDGAPSN